MKEKVILFGSSNFGKAVYEYIKDNYSILFVCDNDEKKWDTDFYNLKIRNPEILKEEDYKQVKIIISSMYFDEIYKQLIELGIDKNNIELSEFEIKNFQQNQYEVSQYNNLKNVIDSFQQRKNYNLHIMIDNFYCKKFIAFINKHFDSKEHKFVILADFKVGIKYVDNISEYDNVEVIYYNKYTKLNLYFYVKNAKKLFIHYLTDFMCKFICDYELWNKTELNWIVWGGDLYHYINYEIYDDLTSDIISKDYIKNDVNSFREKSILNMKNILSAFEFNYNLVKKNFKTNAKYKQFIYPNFINYDLGYFKNVERKGECSEDKKCIMIGNSTDPSNNHLTILYKLQKIELDNVEIIVPLSYGNNEDYKNKIIELGYRLFQDRFVIIDEFMEFYQYINFLNAIDVAIMNHYRSQATGNIFLLILLGKKIILNKNNPLYNELKMLGVTIYDIESLNDSNTHNFFNINFEDIKNNQNIIWNIFNDNNVYQTMKKIFN